MANLVPIFDRFLNIAARVEVGTETLGIQTECVDGEGLKIEWDCKMDVGSSSNSGSIRITNLNTETQIPVLARVAELVQNFGFKAKIFFGWEGQVFQLYEAPILKIRPKIFTGTDIVSEIEIADFAQVGPRSTPGPVLDQAFFIAGFEALAEIMELKLSAQFRQALSKLQVRSTLDNIASVGGEQDKVSVVPGSRARKDFTDLITSLGPQYGWTVQNGEIFLTTFGLLDDTTAPYVLGFDTGLLSVTPQDDGAFSVTAMGIPTLRPGQQVIIQDENTENLGSGALRIEDIAWNGDSYVGCEMGFTARKLGRFGN
jgi:hypothetical protein